MNLKILRKQKHYTQIDIAKLTGISIGHYSMIESKKRNPSIKVAKKLAQVLDFSWEDFFSEEDTNKFIDFKAKRKEKELTVNDVCLLTNIKQKDYLAIEKGQREPNDDELRVLKMIFNL